MYKYNQTYEKEFKSGAIFKRAPKGIIIFDTFNNRWFPIDTVKIDTNMYNMRIIKDDFHHIYGGSSRDNIFLPWHYSVEFIGKSYISSVSRPIMYKSLIPGYEEYISICLVGDTNSDMYTKELYKVIAHNIINSFRYIPGWNINVVDNTELLDIGSSFNESELRKQIK